MKRRDPFRDTMERMERFLESFQELGRVLPESSKVPVDVEETGDEIVVTADLPGVEKDRIEVEATSESLNISAREERAVEEEQKNFYRKERSTRSLSRRISLPAKVDPDSAEASHENGVLTVRLQKSGKDEKKEVEVR